MRSVPFSMMVKGADPLTSKEVQLTLCIVFRDHAAEDGPQEMKIESA